MIAITSRRPVRALEGAAWLGLVCGLLACASLAAHQPPRIAFASPAGLTPDQITAWVTAICGAISALTAAVNGVAIAIHRWGRRPPKPPRKDAPPSQGREA